MKHLKMYIVLLAAFIAQLVFLFKEQGIWWDASIYLGMGHYIYSLGSVGIWEPIRPIAWPLMLGFFWKIGMNDVIMGYILSMAFSIGSALLVYFIGKKLDNEETGFIAALILSFTPIFFESIFRNMTELPSAFFALLALFFYLEKKPFFAGVVAGISFLTKFPNGIVIALLVMGALCLLRIKDAAKTIAGSMIPIIPYLAFNFIMYGNAVGIFSEADAIVKNAGTWLFSGPAYYYLVEILKQNPLYLLSLAGIYALARQKKYIVTAIAIAFFAYFSIHIHKEIRFAVLMLPYFAVLAAMGIKSILKQKWAFWAIAAITLAVFVTHLPTEYETGSAYEGYVKYLEGKEVNGEVLTMHPAVNLYSAKAAIPMYYPVFNSQLAQKWIDYIKQNKERISYAFLDTCEGGMLCHPDEKGCGEKKAELINTLETLLYRQYYAKAGKCEYYVFATQKI